nr:MAG TPA: hypothetical protein [Caudoviricetes sp.]
MYVFTPTLEINEANFTLINRSFGCQKILLPPPYAIGVNDDSFWNFRSNLYQRSSGSASHELSLLT